MRKGCVLALVVLVGVHLVGDLDARGGGRGGGGGRSSGRGGSGRGGMTTGGGGVNRSPSMSRSSYGRTNAGGGNFAGGGGRNPSSFGGSANRNLGQGGQGNRTPNAGNRGNVQNRAQDFAGANRGHQPFKSGGANTPSRQQVQQFLGDNRPAANPGQGGAANKAGEWAQNRNLNTNANNIRNSINNNHPNAGNWFSNSWMNQHNYRPNYAYNWGAGWHPATWGAAAAWLTWNNAVPVSYEYGYSYPVDYTYDNYAYGSQPSNTTPTTINYSPQYVQSAPTTDSSAQASAVQDANWLPLGVYALTSANSTVAPTMYMQLALSKAGEIAGTYYNSTTDKAFPLEGTIDQDTQRAAWKMSDNPDSPIIETGLYNLTQDEAPVSVHFTNGQIQKWILVPVKNAG